ncbi:MAG: hypothetical protein ACRDJC_11735 [Thermomicrobiales bacterium]
MARVRELATLRPGGNPANAPLIGLETYDPEAIIKLLRSIREDGDVEEQRVTLKFLMQALNEGRPEGQKIFPDE